MSAERWVEDTEVERREDGLVLTLHFNDGTSEQRYLAPSDAMQLKESLEEAIHDARAGVKHD